MPQLIADRRDVDFVLHEQLGLFEHKSFNEFNKKVIDLIVSEARNLAIKEILPTFKDGDEKGCRFENGRVTVSLGEKGETIGTLLGQENKGMSAMFRMMNEARAFVGLQGLAVASASYMYALDYARNRIQGRRLSAGADAEDKKVAIIEHPDVKRQLLNMKVYTEGMRSLLYYYARCSDIVHTAEDERLRSNTGALIEVLTPIVKAYITDRALEVCSPWRPGIRRIWLHRRLSGGAIDAGRAHFHDLRGTNGIQAINLIGRKLALNGGAGFAYLLDQMKNTVKKAETVAGLETLAEPFSPAPLVKWMPYLKATAV
jgi:hypothetical protein